MARIPPTLSTIKRLFALSGNECAFPQCRIRLVEDDGTIVGEACHIHAAEPGGPRFKPMQSDDDRRAFDNLILLCANHHRVVDGKPLTANELREIKAAHERQFKANPYEAPEEAIRESVRRLAQRRRPFTAYASVLSLLQLAHPDAIVRMDHYGQGHYWVERCREQRHDLLAIAEVIQENVEPIDFYAQPSIMRKRYEDPTFIRDRLEASLHPLPRPIETHLFIMFKPYMLDTEWGYDANDELLDILRLVASVVSKANQCRRRGPVSSIIGVYDDQARFFTLPSEGSRSPVLMREARELELFNLQVYEFYTRALKERRCARRRPPRI